MSHGTHFWVMKLDCKSMVTLSFFFPKDLGALFGLVSYPGPWSESWRVLFGKSRKSLQSLSVTLSSFGFLLRVQRW